MADEVCWNDDQLANSGVVGVMGQLMGYVGMMTSWSTVGGLMGWLMGYVGMMTSWLTVGWV